MNAFVAVCTLMSVSVAALPQEPVNIDLGGPRKVSATILEREGDYEIRVSLIAVRCFDPSLNRRLSQEKARSFAAEALIRHLRGGKQQSATIRNAEVMEAGIVEARFVLVLRVPRNGVRFLETQDVKPKATPQEGKTSGPLFEPKDDFQETLEIVTRTLSDDLPKFSGKLEQFYEAVSAAEELGVTRLNLLAKEIKEDRWLLSTERDELLRAVTTEEESFLRSLRVRVEEAESNNRGND